MAQIKGTITLNEIDILEVEGNPALSLGTPAALASMAINVFNGDVYSKVGLLDTHWNLITNAPDNNVDGGKANTTYDGSMAIDGGGA